MNFMPMYDTNDVREVWAHNQPSTIHTTKRSLTLPTCKVVAHRYVVAVAHVDADVIEQFVVYQESKIEAVLDIIHEHLGDEIHGKVFKMKSLADVKRTLALTGYLINVIEVN